MVNYSVVVVHITSQTFINNMFYNTVANPWSIELLREELIKALKVADGWNKTMLNKLSMIDSHIKERNRMNLSFFSK